MIKRAINGVIRVVLNYNKDISHASTNHTQKHSYTYTHSHTYTHTNISALPLRCKLIAHMVEEVKLQY